MGGCCETTRKHESVDTQKNSPPPETKPNNTTPAVVPSPPPTSKDALLLDFKPHSKAEVIRLALSVANLTYSEQFLTPEEWQSKDSYEQLPRLEISGNALVGETAVLRYICQTHGFYPPAKDLAAVYRCESICEYMRNQKREMEIEIQKGAFAQNQAYKEATNLLNELSRQLQDVSPYLLGDSLTMADFTCLDFLYTFYLSPSKRLARANQLPASLQIYPEVLLQLHSELQAALDSRLSRPL